MSFVERKLRLTFQLGTGSFGESGETTVVVSDLRISTTITKSGLATMPSAEVRVYGLTLSVMNQLSSLDVNLTGQVRKNTLQIEAGDDSGNFALIFVGTIMSAFVDMSGAPDSPFFIIATTLGFEAGKSIPPTSFKGSVQVATVLEGLATLMQLSFENNGVTTVVSNPYLAGTARDQVLKVIDAAHIEWNGGDNGVLAIWPKRGSRGGSVPLISADSGMVGYPVFQSIGPIVKCVFNPAISIGGKVQIQSILTPCNGIFCVWTMQHDLETQTPGGQWFTTMQTTNLSVYEVNQ
jgi:hypothetical protein